MEKARPSVHDLLTSRQRQPRTSDMSQFNADRLRRAATWAGHSILFVLSGIVFVVVLLLIPLASLVIEIASLVRGRPVPRRGASRPAKTWFRNASK